MTEIEELKAKLKESEDALLKIVSLAHSWRVAEQTVDCVHTYSDIVSLANQTLERIKGAE